MSKHAPVIVKRRRAARAAGAHHGGAWKVAYADFVTAMMAFFLMMWLLNATTEDQRKGLADYFSPRISVARESGGSDAMLNGRTVIDSETLIGRPDGPPDADRAEEDAALEEIAEKFEAASGESEVADDLLRHIDVKITDEGLIAEIFDLPGAPLFAPGSAAPTELMRDLVAVVDEIFAYATNRVAVNGHVRAEAIVRRDRDAWGLSTARAERVRSMLARGHTGPDRIKRLGGFADSTPLHPDRMDVRNNRVEVILLRRP